jgi:hypothetical protein
MLVATERSDSGRSLSRKIADSEGVSVRRTGRSASIQMAKYNAAEKG